MLTEKQKIESQIAYYKDILIQCKKDVELYEQVIKKLEADLADLKAGGIE